MAESIERGAEALDKLSTKKNTNTKKHKKSFSIVGDGGDTFNSNGRRVIYHDPGKQPEITDQLGAAIAEYGGIYMHADRLVRIYVISESQHGGVKRSRNAVILHPIEVEHLIEVAGRAAAHQRFDARSGEYRPCDCPRKIAASYLARGYWPELPILSGFIEAPTITLDGRIIDRPGYDSKSGLFAAFDPIIGYETPPATPTFDEAEKSLSILLDIIEEFPFVAYEDRAAALAGLITGIVRRVLPAAPMFGITAPMPGTGKTYLAESFGLLATGHIPSVLALGKDDAETEKRLTGVLLAGDLIIIIDNIERPLKGDLLNQILTSTSARLRPLGGTGMISSPTNALFCTTGNNLSIVGDLKRRVALIRLDAGLERPEQRVFKHDYRIEIASRRGELISALLTIPLAYLAAGAPLDPQLPSYGGFREWDLLVRRPLVWLGMPDPLLPSESLRRQDPDIEATAALYMAWRDIFGDRSVTAAEVVKAGMSTGVLQSEREYPALYEALHLVCAEKPNPGRLGYWLRRHRDRIVDGLRLEAGPGNTHKKITGWRVVSCG